MFRRQFVQLMTLLGAGQLAKAKSGASTRTLNYLVKGFSCVTCAVGLDTTLQRERGVIWSHSEYPSGKVAIKFDPNEVSEGAIRASIAEMGFTVVEEPAA